MMFLADDSSATIAGEIVGYLLWVGGLGYGIIESVRTSRRESANTPCVFSLMFAYIGILVLVFATPLSKQIPGVPYARMVIAGAGVAIILTAGVLAIVGLVEYSRRRRRYSKGKTRAIITLILCAPIVGLFCIGVVKGILMRPQAQTGEPIAPMVYEDLNFKFAPPRPWMPYETKKIIASATFGVRRSLPEVYFIVIAEKPGMESPLTLDSYVETAKSTLNSAAKSARFISDTRTTKDGMPAAIFETEADLDNLSLYYVHRMIIHNGYAYQLITWGDNRNRDTIRSEAESLASDFQLLHPEKEFHTPGSQAETKFKSANFGYSVDLTATQWNRKWTNINRDAPSAEYGVMRQPTGVFMVLPASLGGEDPGMEILKKALLGRLQFTYPGDEITSTRSQNRDGVQMEDFSADRTADGLDLRYHLRVAKGHGFAWLLAAWFDRKKETHDEILDQALDSVTFTAAPQPDPKTFTKKENLAHGLVCNDIGLAYFKAKQFEQSLVWFKKAVGFNMESKVFVSNALDAYDQLQQPHEGLAFLEQHLNVLTGNQPLQANRAYLQGECGDKDGAIKNYAALFDAGYRSDDYFTNYVRLLSAQNQRDTALTEIEKYLAHSDSLQIRILEASIYRAQGRFDDAINLLQKEQKKLSSDTEVAYALIESFYAAGKFTESIEQCDKLIADGYDSAYANYLKGRSQYALKWYRESKQSFEAALKKEPSNTNVKAYLDQVSGMLGEGSNTDLKTPIDPVPLPKELAEAPPADGGKQATDGYGAYYVTSATAISFEKKKEFKTTEYRTIKVLDSNGVTKFSSLEFPYDPLSEEVFVNSLIIQDAAGKTVSTGKVDDYYTIDDTSSGLATQKKTLHVPVPGLQPGYSVEFVFTRRNIIGKNDDLDFTAHTFSKQAPALRSILYVQGDLAAIKWRATPGIVEKKTDGAISWTIKNPPVWRWEPYQQPADTYMPMVWIGDASETWDAEVKQYASSIHDRMVSDSALHDVALQTTSGIQGNLDKAAALARFVQKDLTYKGIEFGRRACIPQKAGVTLGNKYGDCKDHALLLQQLLVAAGIPANLVLINTVGTVQKQLPSLDQFNHMIVFAPTLGGGKFFDTTDKDSDPTIPVPYGLAGKDALIIDEKEPRFIRISDYPAGSSTLTLKRTVEIIDQSDASVKETLTSTGYAAALLRSSLKLADPANRKTYIQQQMWSNKSTADIKDFSVENIDDNNAPLVLKMTYVMRQNFRAVGHQLIGQVPAPWERFFISAESMDDRQSPFRLNFPLKISANVALTIPAGYEDNEARPSDPKSTSSYAVCKVTPQTIPGELAYNCEFQQSTGIFPATDYSSFQKAMTLTMDTMEQNVLLKKQSK
ncbi:MAG: DUF3857 domain-containing protein [Chthoniobacteraceae bacterium]